MNAKSICFAMVATLTSAALTLTAAYAGTASSGVKAAEDTTVRAFPRTNTGSDPLTQLPYEATVGRPLWAQGQP